MSIRPARTIRAKLALLIAASVGAAVLLSFAVGTYRELGRFGEAKRFEMQATAQVLAASVAEAVARGDRPAALKTLNAIGRMPGVRFAEIRDGQGKIFAEAGSGVALISGAAAPEAAPSLWSMLTQGSFFAHAEIVTSGRRIGSLGILVDTSQLFARLKEALAAAALSAGAAILIGLLIASRLQRSITRPLGDLAETMNRVRLTGNFAARAERRSDDETGQLVDAFNDMLDQIGNRDAALQEHRAGLERTVAERTHELADARDVAESANRAKSDFLATMSHEIRTPLNGMLVMAELLAGASLPARQQRYADVIARSGQTLLTIINDILDLSKIEAGKLDLEAVSVAPGQIVNDVLGLFWERAASKNLDLAAIVAPDVPATIEGDPVRLSQILSNLVNNALKFTERGHVLVEVAVAASDEAALQLRFSVIDTGIGIAADKIAHVFEAFSQADQSTTRRFGGTGLGLSISRRLVGAMGGRIWVESELRRGSRFSFTVRTRALAPAERRAWPSSAAGRRASIAVDGAATRQALASALESVGCEIVEADFDLRRPAGTPADILVAELRHAVRLGAGRAAQALRIVALTPLGDASADALIEKGMLAGALSKPLVSSEAAKLVLDIASAPSAKPARPRPRAERAPLPSLAGLHVLVADDSPVNREVAREALTVLGVACTGVDDGAEAVAAWRAGAFDVVLMDCSMPVLDGFAATREIRRIEAATGAARTPVIALTAHVAGGVADAWQRAGMDACLTKPFTIGSLSDCLSRWAPGGAKRAMAREREERPEYDRHVVEAPALAADTAPLDEDVLDSLRAMGSGDGILKKILEMFLAHAPARREALDEALRRGDMQLVAAEAHALKSPSRNVGALRLAEYCGEVEARARSGRADLDATLLAALGAEYARATAQARGLVAGNGDEAAAPTAPAAVA